MKTAPTFDPTRILLTILFVGLLIFFSLWIMRPFLLSITWACMIVVATWPLFLMLKRRLGGRGWAAVAILTLGQLTLLFLPLSLAIGTLVTNADTLIGWFGTLSTMQIPAPPQWLQSIPSVGPKLVVLWRQTADAGIGPIAVKAAPYANELARWFGGKVGGLGIMAVQFLLTVVISAVMYSHAPELVTALRRFMYRLGGDRGEDILVLASQAIRGVAMGVGVTALIQALLAGLGLAMAGIPATSILTALIFMLCIAQIGALPVLVPACIWLYWSGHTGWGTFMLIWALVVGNIDAVLRPMLIKRGADLPLILILTGVIGGLIGFGLLGIFLGPLILAISFRMVTAWVNETRHAAEDPLIRE